MGFPIWPEPPRLGVYVFRPTGDLLLVLGFWIYEVSIVYRPGQRKPKRASESLLDECEYLGEL